MAVADVMPKNPSEFPIMGMLILDQLILIVLATLTSLGILFVHSQCFYDVEEQRMPPEWLMRLAGMWPGGKHVAVMPKVISENGGEHEEEEVEKSCKMIYTKLCYRLDMICMIGFVTLDVISLAIITISTVFQ